MDLTIMVVNWNTTDLLVKCLQSVQKHGTGIGYDLIVADNASTDANVRLTAKRFTEFKWLFSRKNEGGLIVNHALRHIQGRYVLFLGSDAQIQPGCLQEMIQHLDSFPMAGGVSAMLLNPDLSPQYYYRRLPETCTIFFCQTALGSILDRAFFGNRFAREYEYQGISLESIVEIEQPPAACLMIRSDLVRDKNGQIIDPRFPFYFNDVDLCKRIYNAGYHIYVLPEAKVIHQKSASFSKRKKVWNLTEYFTALYHYIGKYHHGWVLVFYVYLICQTIFSIGTNLLRFLFSPNIQRYRTRLKQLYQLFSRITRLRLSTND